MTAPDQSIPRPVVGVSDLTRRSFTDAVGLAGVFAVLGLPAYGQQAKQMLGPQGMQPAVTKAGRIFLSDEEADFIEAVVARLIPAEGNGPSALEAGVPNFIDKQLGGAWGQGERLFMGGPFDPAAIPQLGYQLPYLPADLFRRSMAAIATKMAPGTPFAALAAQDQDRFISDQLEGGGLGNLNGVPAKVFFEHLLEMTLQGYFSDPVYGGNKDMVAWKAIGFPGAYDSYRSTVGLHGQAFTIGPFSLADHDTIPEQDMKDMEVQR